MEDNINKEFELKDKVLNFATNNKKIYSFRNSYNIFNFLMTYLYIDKKIKMSLFRKNIFRPAYIYH